MAAKGQEKLPTNGSYDSKYQRIMGQLFSACNDVNECSECIGELEDDLCWWVFRVMDRQTPLWWEKNIAEAKLKERSVSKPQKGRTPPKPKRPVVKELWITCPNCKVQETITLEDWILESTVKFDQVAKSLTVLHRCGGGVFCEVTLPDGKVTVAEYIKRRKKGKK